MTTRHLAAVLLAVLVISLPGAAQTILNGGFESGFAGWTVANSLGSDGSFHVQTGTTSPVNGEAVPAPPEGLQAAMTDAGAPGTHVLYQDIFIPSTLGTALLSYQLFIGNRADDFYVPTPPSLDFAQAALNQQARVDILRAGTDPFSLASADVLLNLYQTQPGDPLVSGYTSFSHDLTTLLASHAGQTVRLRFAETDNVFIFQLGVDNVAFAARPTPVPDSGSTLALSLTAFFSLFVFSRRPSPRAACRRCASGGLGRAAD